MPRPCRPTLRATKALAVPLISVALAACIGQDASHHKEADELADKVASLEAKMATMQLELNLTKLEAETRAYKSATFDPAEPKGYQRIDTTGGIFLVSLQDVSPYVDGFRVTFTFGNPSAATFNGFKLKAKWGPRFEVGANKPNFETWSRNLKEKELSLTNNLLPGSWNPVSFVLAPAKSEEFGYLELSLETNNVSLR